METAYKNDKEIIYTMGMPAKWAALYPDKKSPYSEEITCSPPSHIELWRRYVRVLGNRYKGKIKYWEIWNEPDHPFVK